MLPTGHIAAGYLTGCALLKIANPELNPAQTNYLLAWAAFFGFAPDIDVFWFFVKNRTLLVGGKAAAENSHRKFFLHVPLYWLLAGLAVYFFSPSVYYKIFGLLIWLASWSHFMLDSIEYGIAWLSPFSPRFYGLKDLETKAAVEEKIFFRHSLKFLKIYSKSATFYLEILIILTALIVYFK